MRRSVAEMGGEFLRETGVLVLVFYGPAALLSGAQKPSAWLAFFGFATGLIVWLFGVLVERRRTE
ncbi:MAG TPA: hypothetical protein VGB47_07880 [Thermoanaerobaculia bacterium]|jgi:hypothetical protein